MHLNWRTTAPFTMCISVEKTAYTRYAYWSYMVLWLLVDILVNALHVFDFSSLFIVIGTDKDSLDFYAYLNFQIYTFKDVTLLRIST